ncbi:hypothetical protein HZI73_26070 (plasmid) [Vallitalea pronyensis]|uniref:PcfK-like protein n=1 Tax=Vallitalea pronyensis TaxID=1348613 RepID=A0A8J8MQP4_9FIRM|nr:Cas9 inhibitor AcrIIA9 family protein [Vallitalea pronyensis]QUI25882.1 hypothetical protein HZI73_26070 [Vallitalea pronyensis]
MKVKQDYKKQAINKVNQEIEEYRQQQKKKTVEIVYKLMTQHMFTEATAHYSLDLIKKSERIARLVLEKEANTVDCAKAVIAVARKTGSLGAMQLEHFYNAIWDYYKIDHKEVKELERIEALKREEARKKRLANAAKRKKSSTATQPENKADNKQLSLF